MWDGGDVFGEGDHDCEQGSRSLYGGVEVEKEGKNQGARIGKSLQWCLSDPPPLHIQLLQTPPHYLRKLRTNE